MKQLFKVSFFGETFKYLKFKWVAVVLHCVYMETVAHNLSP